MSPSSPELPEALSREKVFVNQVEHGTDGIQKVFNVEIGRISGLPFDKTVRDVKGNKIGELESGFGIIPTTLRRW